MSRALKAGCLDAEADAAQLNRYPPTGGGIPFHVGQLLMGPARANLCLSVKFFPSPFCRADARGMGSSICMLSLLSPCVMELAPISAPLVHAQMNGESMIALVSRSHQRHSPPASSTPRISTSVNHTDPATRRSHCKLRPRLYFSEG